MVQATFFTNENWDGYRRVIVGKYPTQKLALEALQTFEKNQVIADDYKCLVMDFGEDDG